MHGAGGRRRADFPLRQPRSRAGRRNPFILIFFFCRCCFWWVFIRFPGGRPGSIGGGRQRRAAGRAGPGGLGGRRGRRCGASLCLASSPGAWGAGPDTAAERPPRPARPRAAATATAAWTAPGGGLRPCLRDSAPSRTHCESGPGRAGR